jgi:hypothetical protein
MSLGEKLFLAAAFTTLAAASVQAQGHRTGQVKITSPANGAEVSGTVAVTAQTAGDVAWINFYLDGTYEAASPPDTWDWNTSGLSGSHTVSVEAFSANDQLLGSDQVTVTVVQATPTPLPTATTTSSPTPTPAPSATPTPYPTASATPKPSPTATATSTPSPTATPSATPTPTGTTPIKANDFLNSLGVGTKRTQGIDSVSQIEAALSYSGIRNIRDDGTTNSSLWSDFCNIHAANGVTVMLLPVRTYPVSTAEYDALAACGAIDQVEGPNEPNNFPFTYNGQNCGGLSATWAGCAAFQRDLYNAVKADSHLGGVRVLDLTEPGAEDDNQGLQFLTIPSGAGTLQPGGTIYADVANLHNYVQGNSPNNILGDNQAWEAEAPGAAEGSFDGPQGEYIGSTWHNHYGALALSAGPSIPKETTETGWRTGTSDTTTYITQDQQGKLLVDVYLSAAKRGWLRTYIYELFDDPYDTFGIFTHNGSGATPKLAGTYIHNLTSILNDASSSFTPTPLAYSVNGETSTIHDLLLQKSNGVYELAVWGDRPVSGTTTAVTVSLPGAYPTINVYDVTSGTSPIDTLSSTSSVPLTITDHALVVEFGG